MTEYISKEDLGSVVSNVDTVENVFTRWLYVFKRRLVQSVG